jgi:alpha-glucuronidase
MPRMRPTSVALVLLFMIFALVGPPDARADDGYRLWLRYDRITDAEALSDYRAALRAMHVAGPSATLSAAKRELTRGLEGLLDTTVTTAGASAPGTVVVGTPDDSPRIAALGLEAALRTVGPEGFVLRTVPVEGGTQTVIAANEDVGALYGVFHLLRRLQTHRSVANLDVVEAPEVEHRVLNHWDNLDRTVERGYAGFSIWDWWRLPEYKKPRYTDYARANASLGINGTVLTNVNADATVLTPRYLEKVAALAEVFRPYGIQVYLTARFSAPTEIGGLDTADPLDPEVREWWVDKVDQIYERIPDFGGFLVKADSEGQPGPHDYDRTHAEGANMLARALAPHDGTLMWRAFVYSNETPEDRAKQAYTEFTPLDGEFRDNVLLQVKNGPIDFQPREPFHPLFGAMPETPLMMEFQITKEYLGFATHLVYMGPYYEEALRADTYAKGEGSTVADVVNGSLHEYEHTGMAGVSNIGTSRDWTGSHFNQANWYVFGKLAWDPGADTEAIAREWIRRTYTNDSAFVAPVTDMMMASREAAVNYMTPLGLHHQMGAGHHYGPAPWVDVEDVGRRDWTSVYYHRADSTGIGFDRSASGTNAVAQYHSPVEERFNDREEISDKYLLWFHHVPWDYEMDSGRTLWTELVHRYNAGVDTVRWMQDQWAELDGMIDEERYDQTETFLEIQRQEAVWWRDASLQYFQTFSERPIPDRYEQPAHSLEYYRSLTFPNAPGI